MPQYLSILDQAPIKMITLKHILKSILVIVILFTGSTPLKAQGGEDLYKKNCAVCHRIGGGKLVGPDLKGITDLRKEDWLIKWIKSSQTLIKSGDADAKAVFDANNQIAMPDQNFSDVEVKDVLAYIKSQSGTGEATAAAATTEPAIPIKNSDNATPEEILLGQHFFEGDARLTNGGPSCISCHNVMSDKIIPGGLLAKDLTNVHSRLGGDAGLMGILNAPPFPAMTEAYKGKPITQTEIEAITAFLNKADKESATQTASMNPLLKWGFLGFAFWIVIVLFLWHNRKGSMVKQRIYDRQVRTR